MPREHPLDDAFGQYVEDLSKADPGIPAAERWEHKVVYKLLKYYGMESIASEMAGLVRDRTGGVKRLTFAMFKEYQPKFPMWLVCRRVPYIHAQEPQDYFRKFAKTRLYKSFLNA